MQVTPHVHAVRISFRLQAGPGKTIERFVYAYIVFGQKIYLIDCGVKGSSTQLLDYIRQAGRDPRDIAIVLLTHAHPDHMGGLLELKNATGCRVAAHSGDVPWVEDVDRQNRERTIPNFGELVEGNVKVDTLLQDGDRIDLGDGSFLEVRHTPGHSAGHLCFLYPKEGVLFSGDAVPFKGAVPIYDEVDGSLDTLETIRNMKGWNIILSSWDEPRRGEEIAPLLDSAAQYIRDIHGMVGEELNRAPELKAEELSERVLSRLGLADAARVPIVVRTIRAHMNARNVRFS